MKQYQKESTQCPVLIAQRVLSGKWSLAVIYYLGKETLRFGQLQRKLPFLTQATLSRQLKELVDMNIVVRRDYGELPPRVEYSLSEIGQQLLPIIDALEQWSSSYQQIQEKDSN